jgi:hypothetical protein
LLDVAVAVFVPHRWRCWSQRHNRPRCLAFRRLATLLRHAALRHAALLRLVVVVLGGRDALLRLVLLLRDDDEVAGALPGGLLRFGRDLLRLGRGLCPRRGVAPTLVVVYVDVDGVVVVVDGVVVVVVGPFVRSRPDNLELRLRGRYSRRRHCSE